MGADTDVRVKNIGLRGVTVADTKISYIDGDKGVLIYRGYLIEELAERSSFMETAYLLLNGVLPARWQLEEFEGEVKAARDIPGFVLDGLRMFPKEAGPMDVLQAAVPMLGIADPDLLVESREADVRKAIRLMARVPAVVAAWHRIRSGEEPLAPDMDLSHSANFLWQLTGEKPDAETARDFDVCLVLHADHTFNASTFACREVVSTKAHMYAGVAAGVGALSGSLHGGANARVMKMLLQVEKEVESEFGVSQWLKDRIDRGEKIMGMGHAVYKTYDPRATVLKKMSQKLAKKTGHENWYRLLARIEEEGVKEFGRRGKHSIRTNVDFYSGSVYAMMGIPIDIMTPVFAISRVSGWCAHVIEEKLGEAQGKPALYRPEAEYIGHYCGALGCTYEPVEARA
jgi:citrate synthase